MTISPVSRLDMQIIVMAIINAALILNNIVDQCGARKVNCLHNLSIVGHPKLLSWQMSAISMDGQAKPQCLKKSSLLASINVTCTEPWVKKFLGASNGEELFTSRSYTRMEKINAILFCFLDQNDGTHLGQS